MLPSPPEAGAGHRPQELRLAVPNELAAIEATRLRVHAFLGEHTLPARWVQRLELVLEEMLMNRLMHAHPEGGRHSTELSVRWAADALVLCFEDDGLPFNPLAAEPRVPPTSLQDATPGGYGLMLIRKAASACSYERIDGRNRCTVQLARP